LQICHCYFVQDLVNLGIVEDKSKILEVPKIEEKYYRDWIRGYFDGDGSISYIKKRKQITGEFFSASEKIIQFIVENIPESTLTVSKKRQTRILS